MISLNISFTGNTDAEMYNVCYRSVGSVNYTCSTTTTNNLIINSGIICGVNYEGYIETICNSVDGFKSSQVQFFTTGVVCQPGQETPLTITLNSVTSGCVYFTTTGPAQSGITIQTSTNGGSTWVDSAGSFTSPSCGLGTPIVDTKYRLKSVNSPFVYSNVVDYIVSEPTPTNFCDGCVGTEKYYTMTIGAGVDTSNIGVNYTPFNELSITDYLSSVTVMDNLDGSYTYQLCSDSAPYIVNMTDNTGILWIEGNFEEVPCSSTLIINSSVPTSGVGTLDFSGGEPNEIINLNFQVTDNGNFGTLDFTAPVTVALLDSLHLTRNGSIQLDSAGNATSTYDFSPTDASASVVITITGRSSGLAIPINDYTGVANN